MNNASASEYRRPASSETVSLEASYAFDGLPPRQTRVHQVSPSGLRILTHEQLTLRRMISIEIKFDGGQRVCLLGQILRLVETRGSLHDYELQVLGEHTLQNALRSSSAKKRVDERRPATRVSVDLKATYKIDGRSTSPTRVHEISASGLRIVTNHELPIRGLITVDIMFALNYKVRVLGQIVRLASRNESEFDYGLKVIGDNTMKNPLRAAVLHLNLKSAGNKDPGLSGYIPSR